MPTTPTPLSRRVIYRGRKVDLALQSVMLADGSLAETPGTPLALCRPGQEFRVVRVMDQDPAFLRYLSECGLDLHATIAFPVRGFIEATRQFELGHVGLDLGPQVDLHLCEEPCGKHPVKLIRDGVGPP